MEPGVYSNRVNNLSSGARTDSVPFFNLEIFERFFKKMIIIMLWRNGHEPIGFTPEP